VPTAAVPVEDIDNLAAQQDAVPQQLLLKTYSAPSGGPPGPGVPYGRRVHRLFCGRTAPITVFPDHMHEGHLVVPSALPADPWPSGPSGQPRPEVIAQGTDKRNGRIYDLVIAYDGHEVSVGRIVADSTWHHYFNVNLKGFPAGGPVLSQLAQFYVNLAVWLAPPAKRAQIACWLRWKVLHVPTVEMAKRDSPWELGRTGFCTFGALPALVMSEVEEEDARDRRARRRVQLAGGPIAICEDAPLSRHRHRLVPRNRRSAR
jgi:hypothetical protein